MRFAIPARCLAAVVALALAASAAWAAGAAKTTLATTETASSEAVARATPGNAAGTDGCGTSVGTGAQTAQLQCAPGTCPCRLGGCAAQCCP